LQLWRHHRYYSQARKRAQGFPLPLLGLSGFRRLSVGTLFRSESLLQLDVPVSKASQAVPYNCTRLDFAVARCSISCQSTNCFYSFQVNLLVQASDITIGGTIKPNVYSVATAAGNESNRNFCPRCGSSVYRNGTLATLLLTELHRPIMTTITGKPDLVFVKGGMFRKHGLDLDKPFKEQWFRRAEVWETPYVPETKVLM